MRIAYLVNQYPKISHTFIRREIRALDELGVDVVRFSVRRTREILTDAADKEEAARTHVILDSKPHDFFASSLASLRDASRYPDALRLTQQVAVASGRPAVHAAYLAEALRVRAWCQELGVDHIHAHFGTNSTTVAMLCQALGGPSYSFTVHGPEEFDRPDNLSLKEKIKRCAFVCGISSYGRSQLLRRTEYPQWSKVQVVRCGVDRSFYDHPAEPVPDTLEVTNVGRLTEQKGQLMLVDAIARAKERHPGVHLRLVGDGAMRQGIEARIAEVGIQENVTLTGWTDEAGVRKAMEETRGLVLPSFAEGLPVVLMEAMALGRPAVTTYVAGIPELVNAECGWMFPASDTDALHEALLELLETPIDQVRRMGEVGRSRVLEQHDILKSAAKLKELFEQVTS